MIAVIIGLIFLVTASGYSFLAYKNKNTKNVLIIMSSGLMVFCLALALSPYVAVWQAALAGEALLKEAEWSRQIIITRIRKEI